MSNLSPEDLQLDLVLSSFAREVKYSYTADPHADSNLIYQRALLEALNKTGSALVKRTPPRSPNVSSDTHEIPSYDTAYYRLHPDKPVEENPDFLSIGNSEESLQNQLVRSDRMVEEITQFISRIGPG